MVPENNGKLNILIDDDQADVLSALGGLVRGLGHACTVADSAARARRLMTGTG